MRTSRPSPTARHGTVTRFLAALVAGVAGPTPVVGQEPAAGTDPPPLTLVAPDARVGSVRFDLVGRSSLSVATLRRRIAYEGPGALAGLRSVLAIVPGISRPELEPFSPLTLQQDVARLRRVYRRFGFPEADVDYRVAYDDDARIVDLTFVVDQGRELVLGEVEVELDGDEGPGASDGGARRPIALPEELRDAWADHLAELRRGRGTRFGEQEQSTLVNRTADWFLDHGYPWVTVRVVSADTTASSVAVSVGAKPGPRARVDSIAIVGRQRLSDPVLRREIPLRPGDWYSARTVTVGERELYELGLVRRALGDVVADQPPNGTVALQYRIDEARPRLVRGRAGWRSESGLAAEAHWSHRDFLGGARELTTSVAAETGWWALEDARSRGIGVAAMLRQPYLAHRSVGGSLGPFAEYRDDAGQRSLELGVESAVTLRTEPLRSVTLRHEISRTRVDDAADFIPVRTLVQEGDSAFAPVFVESAFGLLASYGTLDDRLDPRVGFLVEPDLRLTGPSRVSDVEYVRLAFSGFAAAPLTERVGVFVRATAGRLLPFGLSRPVDGGPRTRALVGLRDVLFTAGGTADVRGWGRGLVGSKTPEVTVGEDGVVDAARWVPLGALARLGGSMELALPMPPLPAPHRTFVFVDAGRVWSPDPGFEPGDPALRQEGWAVGTGLGVQLGTPVGPIRLSVGYKLNPSVIDLLDPGDVARALAVGGTLDGLDADGSRRWHLHLSIGRSL